jgi:hypothetical protein
MGFCQIRFYQSVNLTIRWLFGNKFDIQIANFNAFIRIYFNKLIMCYLR